MRAQEIIRLWEEHGGLRAVHTIPVRGGWQNVYVCKDGYRRANTKREDDMLTAFQRRQRAVR